MKCQSLFPGKNKKNISVSSAEILPRMLSVKTMIILLLSYIVSDICFCFFLSRCWQCGEDMSGRVPFEYMDYKFCTSKCLQIHRKQKTTK